MVSSWNVCIVERKTYEKIQNRTKLSRLRHVSGRRKTPSENMKDMGERGGPTYFQSFEELEESLPEKKRQLKDLNRGWPITVLLDPWEALHFWGYDAHTITE